MDKMRMETPDLTARNVERIGALFPNCVTETVGADGKPKEAINFDLLRQMLSGDVIEGNEAYEFTWVGKKAAIVEANKPIRETLRPCPAESVDWDTTENLYIEGDNLDVLKLLQKSYLGKVKMIYIDPPYNTGHEFVYHDSFVMEDQDYDAGSGYYDADGNISYTCGNNATDGRYHSNWCSMIYARLLLSRDFLREDGVIFISIDDNELDDLRKICNEIFGRNHFLACFPRVTKRAGKSTETIAKNHDYVLAYSKSDAPSLYLPAHTDDGFKFSDAFEDQRGKYKLNQTLDYNSLQYSPSLDYPITIDGETMYPGQSYEKYLERKSGKHSRADWAWRWSRDLFDFGYANGFIVLKKYEGYSRIYTKTYQNCKIVKKGTGFEIEYIQRTKPISTLEFVKNEFSNDNSKKNLVRLFGSSVFDYSKPTSLLSALVQFSTEKEDIVLDFFSGSATTAHPVMQQNCQDGGRRKFIMVQLPEPCNEKSDAFKAGYSSICEIGKERIRRAGRKIKEENPSAAADLDTGFRVFRLDDTNVLDAYYCTEEYSPDLIAHMESNMKPGRTDLDLLFGCLLEWGLPLSLPYHCDKLDGCTIYTCNNGDFIACFDENIPASVVMEIAGRQPLQAIFRASGFAGNPAKMNVWEQFKLLTPDTHVKVI